MRNKRNRKLMSILLTLSLLVTLLVPMVGPASADATYTMTNVQTIKVPYNDGAATPGPKAIGSMIINFDAATAAASAGKYVYLNLPSSPSGFELEFGTITYVGTAGTGVTPHLNVDGKAYMAELVVNTDGTDSGIKPTATATSVQIIVPLLVKIPGGVSGEVKLTASRPSSSTFANGDVVIAKVGGSSVTLAAESVKNLGSGGGDVGVIDIKEGTQGSLANSGGTKALKLKLPPGFKWRATPDVTYMWGNLSLSAAQFDIAGDDGRTMAISVDETTQVSTSGTFFKLTGAIDIDESVAKVGDVTVSVSGATSASPTSLVVAKYGDFSTSYKALSAPEIVAGKNGSDIGKIELKESIAGSFIDGRTVTLTLPDNVKWSQTPGFDEDASSKQGVNGIDWTVVGSDAKMIKGVFNVEPSASDPADIVLKNMQVTPAVDFNGDLKVTIGGSQGLTGDAVLAKVIAGVTATASSKPDVKIGLPGQSMGDLTITELAAGNLGSSITYSAYNADKTLGTATGVTSGAQIIVKAPAGVTFDSTPTYEVTAGDLQIDSVKTDTTDANEGVIYIKIKSSSTTASTIKLSGLKLTVDRTIPEGPLTMKVRGTSLDETTMNSAGDEIFSGHKDAVSVVAASVVTPAPGTTKATAVFKIGDTKFTLNGVDQTMDAAPYLSNDRTYLPLRFVAKAVGVPDSNIIWNAGDQTVVLIKDGSVVKLTIGSTTMYINGTPIAMDVAPEIVDPGRTMLPVRWVAQALGANIQWDNATQTVTVN